MTPRIEDSVIKVYLKKDGRTDTIMWRGDIRYGIAKNLRDSRLLAVQLHENGQVVLVMKNNEIVLTKEQFIQLSGLHRNWVKRYAATGIKGRKGVRE